MRVYITKYATTSGILIKEARLCSIGDGKMIDCGGIETYHKPHWHESREAALQRAEEMRHAEIKSLKKKLERLQNMTFLIPGDEA